MKPTLLIVLDTRRALQTGPDKGKYPIKLKATFQVIKTNKKTWIPKYYPLNIYCTKSEYKRASANPRTSALKSIKTSTINALAKAQDIMDSHPVLTIEKFEQLFTLKQSHTSIAALFDLYISQMQAENRVGNAIAYTNAKSSFTAYGGEHLQLVEITPRWLKQYESYMLDKERSRTTVGMYIRCLRKVYNIAIDEHLISIEFYPFGRKGYTIPKGSKRKQFLTEDQKNKLLKFKFENQGINRAVSFWIFSYFCNGMNFGDIALLKRKQLTTDSITFTRKKTLRSSSTSSSITIPLRREVQAIINRYGSHSLNPNDYLFPILENGMSHQVQKKTILQFIKTSNKFLSMAGDQLKLPFKLTTNIARHTFATIALRKGANKEFIQEALGHTSMLTTENYIGGLDFETKKAISDKL